MNRLLQSIWKTRYVLILILPMFYFFAGLYIKLILDDPSLRSIDPDYAYFISGLNMSEGIFKLTHIDHPGTPLQYLIALVIKAVHLFRSNPDATMDVLANPDLYLTIVNITITSIVAISLFIAGNLVFRKTNSVLYAMLIQTVPFVTYIWYEIVGRIISELLMPLPIIALSVLIIDYIYSEKEKMEGPQLLTMSIILAFALTLKLTLAPLLLIPLVIVKTWKKKIYVLSLTLLFFLIIAVPVTLQPERFFNWTKNLFLHSGYYGSGEKNIVDPNLFIENFYKILYLEKSFSYLVVFLTLISFIAFIWFRKRLNSQVSKKLQVSFGVLLLILVQIIMIGKHYSPRYFIPAVMFSPLLVFLLIEIIKEFNTSKILNVILMSLLAVYLGWHIQQQLFTIGYTSDTFQNQIDARKVTRGVINTFEKESIKIIVSQDYGSPFPEYALHFSTVWSAASARERYREILGKIFPYTYQYTTWDGNFIHWGEPFDQSKIVSGNIPVYLYLENNSAELYQKAIEKIFPVNELYTIDAGHIFTNSVNGEAIYKVNLRQK
ncbi:MAG: hypothetical protein K0B11_06455 [Mariniphaga sp.]|nr:hypothetical protein [Mariniphaga sp.]